MCPRLIPNAFERSMVIASAVCSLESKLVVMSSHVLRRAVANEFPFGNPDKLSLRKFRENS